LFNLRKDTKLFSVASVWFSVFLLRNRQPKTFPARGGVSPALAYMKQTSAIWKKCVFREFPEEVIGEEEKSRIFANRN